MRNLSWEQVELLPNPHLRHFVTPDIFKLDEKDFDKAIRKATLEAAHLPPTYDYGTEKQKKDARLKVLKSWFDPKEPNVLCNNVENAVAAHFLWSEFYMKPDDFCGGMYSFKDSVVKYDIVRGVLARPIIPSEPAKCVMHCPRGTTKTFTVIRELAPMIAINRPYSKILVSEINKDRTIEEMDEVRQIIENNELIHRDFGGMGTLWTRNSHAGTKWCGSQLDFLLHPGCCIKGFSFHSAQRGRHPILGIIDDPEDQKLLKIKDFRRRFFKNLFETYRGMFYVGSHIVWIGTVMQNSCLQVALKALIEEPVDETDLEENYDERFESWHKIHFGMINTDPETGETYSIMSDHTPVSAIADTERGMGKVAAAAELGGKPILEGVNALVRDAFKHGYMHCKADPNDLTNRNLPDEYMLDLNTGRIVPWQMFLESLFKAVGCDIADSLAKDADRGSVCCVGLDPERDVYVLDILVKRQISDLWPETAINMAVEWGCNKAGLETAAMQKVYYRMATRLRDDFEARGLVFPTVVPIVNSGINKHLRVLGTLRPLYRMERIRFPYFKTFTGANGVVHHPAPCSNERSFRELFRELDAYTDEGNALYDDATDSLQISIRAAGRGRGTEAETLDESQLQLEKWKKAGVTWPQHLLPEHLWPAEAKADPVVVTDPRKVRRPDPYAYV